MAPTTTSTASKTLSTTTKKKTKRGTKSKPIKKSKSESKTLSPEETFRKDIQRQVQQLVIKLRSEGRAEDEIGRRKWGLKKKLESDMRSNLSSANGATNSNTGTIESDWSKQKKEKVESLRLEAKEYWKEKKKENAETLKNLGTVGGSGGINVESAPVTAAVTEENDDLNAETDEANLEKEIESNANAGRLHDIVIIPIVWRGRHDRQQLINVAEEVKKMLLQTTNNDLDVWIDSRRHLTPGSKFAFWEHKTVKFRIEIGPKDLERRQICLCRHPETPGDYQNTVKKWVDMDNNREILIELTKLGVKKLDGIIKVDRYEMNENAKDSSSGIKEVQAGTVMERIANSEVQSTVTTEKKLDYSSMYSKDEVGGTVADYTKRFASDDSKIKETEGSFRALKIAKQHGGGGIVKPKGVDGEVVENTAKSSSKVNKSESKSKVPKSLDDEDNFELLNDKPSKVKKDKSKTKVDYGNVKKIDKKVKK